VLIIKRIHVTYRLRLEAEKRDAAERAHGIHADFCPVARSIRGCIDISTSLEMDDL
jgi:organic hydroperoxide reductase OsmC/OhrA